MFAVSSSATSFPLRSPFNQFPPESLALAAWSPDHIAIRRSSRDASTQIAVGRPNHRHSSIETRAMNAILSTTTSDASEPSEHPPRFRMVFRVGIVGHRPNRLKAANLEDLAVRIRETLTTVKDALCEHCAEHRDLYLSDEPVTRAVSPLAEGVDRIFADQAFETGCELCAVLPFHREEYELDFDPSKALEPNSRERFHDLLARATTAFELDGSRLNESEAYGVAGRVVLNQSDLLIVVWDGERRNLRGGTEETFDAALVRGVPIVWIDAHAPHHWQLVTSSTLKSESFATQTRAALDQSDHRDAIRECVRGLIDLPGGGAMEAEHPSDDLRVFLGERKARWNLACWWKLFRDFAGDLELRRPTLKVTPYEESVRAGWPTATSTAVEKTVDQLRPYYAWPDKLADRYADLYRSAFVVAFLAAAFAVAMALVPIGLQLQSHGWGETLSTVLELLAIVFILTVVIWGRTARWHGRWLDYRLLAEMVRHLRLIAHLGGERAVPSVPAHWANYGDPSSSWMAWYVRGLERAIGLPSVVVDRAHLQECLADLREQIGGAHGQIVFHRTTAARCERIEYRLERVEVGLLILTLFSCVGHLAPAIFSRLHYSTHPLTFFCGALPALGAALAGINNQGEFRRISKRSKSMSERLEQQMERVRSLQEKLDTTNPSVSQLSVDAAAVAGDIARLMVNEVLDWRVMFQDRPLHTT